MSEDTISKKAAIDAFLTELTKRERKNLLHTWSTVEVKYFIVEMLEQLQSAQPETHEERTETHACDLIERQAAIDAHYEYCNKHPDAGFPVWSLKILEDLPPVQPDNSCDGCRYENADDGVLVPCGFCKRNHPDNYERRTDDKTNKGSSN